MAGLKDYAASCPDVWELDGAMGTSSAGEEAEKADYGSKFGVMGAIVYVLAIFRR
jgi:hypothetical protein